VVRARWQAKNLRASTENQAKSRPAALFADQPAGLSQRLDYRHPETVWPRRDWVKLQHPIEISLRRVALSGDVQMISNQKLQRRVIGIFSAVARKSSISRL